ncbi:thrombospondin type 3 repeat-containing protein [Catellatospora sichuanensis]|uniref:thrombospondin type 3 repeat-containing protein n=1 Tax=Catellatospora sichuanensis TaxID=1969805 RepID=UPI001181E75C|nr:thrombospondin type 3 repeat-containing protein [Catellatospora sichuanensis]
MMFDIPRRTAATVAAAVLLAATVAVEPAYAADRPVPKSTLRVCDPTGCYTAWRVVDSDHDGISDADELMAGTNPYDANSRPPLELVVELALDRKLPSFEAGLGAFLAVPQEIVDARDKVGMDVLGAFDMASRRDTLTHFGLTFGELQTGGVDVDPTQGFTIGLAGKGGLGSLPGARIGGISMGLISAGADNPKYRFGQEHGGVKSTKPIDGGTGTHTEFNDGASQTTRSDGEGGFTRTTTNADGSAGPQTTGQSRESSDGDGGTRHEEKQTTTDADGNLDSVTYTDEHRFAGGAVSTMTTTTKYVRDENGNVTGSQVTTVVSYVSADGEYGSADTTVEDCDGAGNCTVVDSDYEDSDTVDDEEYYNPDADTTIVTFEAEKNVLRTRGAAVNTVPGWAAPGFEGDVANPKDPNLVALIDSDLSPGFMLVSPPRITKAQPEFRDDLPLPGQPAPKDCPSCR